MADTAVDEQVLLAAARRLDPEALGAIHNAFYGPIFRYVAFRVGDREAAEDLTNDVFVRLLDALHSYRAPETTLRGWLFGVAANVVSDHHRKAYRRDQVPLDTGIRSPEPSPYEAARSAGEHVALRQALAKLTEDQQRVIALRFGDGLPIREVADILGRSEGAIKQLQARAVARLTVLVGPEPALPWPAQNQPGS